MDVAKKPHSLDKTEVAQPELYFSTMKTMDDKAIYQKLRKARFRKFGFEPTKTNENREKEKDKSEAAQSFFTSPYSSLMMMHCNYLARHYNHLKACWKTNENREKEKDKNEVDQSFYTRPYLSRMIYCDDAARQLEEMKARLMEVYCEPMKTYENQDKEKDKNEVAQPEDLRADSGALCAMMKTNENREKEKDKTEVAQPEVEGFDESFNPNDWKYLENPSIIALNPDDEVGYLEHSKARHLEQVKACLMEFYCEPMKTYETQEKEKDKNEDAQPEDLRADSGASCAMMKTNENREKEKDKTEVAQPEVEGFDESFNPNDQKYLENPSIIALNPDDELEYWKHWEAYEKKNENREKDKKEVAQPEVEGLDESFDPNDRNYLENPSIIALNPDDELEYWKHWEAYEKKDENREKDKKEVEQPEVEGLDESFDPNDRNYLENQYFVTLMNPNDEVEYWKHGKVCEKKNGIDDREIEKED